MGTTATHVDDQMLTELVGVLPVFHEPENRNRVESLLQGIDFMPITRVSFYPGIEDCITHWSGSDVTCNNLRDIRLEAAYAYGGVPFAEQEGSISIWVEDQQDVTWVCFPQTFRGEAFGWLILWPTDSADSNFLKAATFLSNALIALE